MKLGKLKLGKFKFYMKIIFLFIVSLCLVLLGEKYALADDDFDLDAIESEMSRRGEQQAVQSKPEEQEKNLEEDKTFLVTLIT